MPKKQVSSGRSKAGPTALRVRGFRASGISAGIKKTGRPDLALILSDVPAETAGVFTTNRVKAAPVVLSMKRVKGGTSRGVVINSGNANACTGAGGSRVALEMASSVEKALGLKKGEMLVCSTGVIGVPLPVEKVRKAVPALVEGLSARGLSSAARAIMTTDAFPKTAVGRTKIDGRTVTVAGVAKGAGMICPDMATLLAFFMTDANIRHAALSSALKGAVDGSFNSIVVDNDTSTNDTALAFANGASGGPVIRKGTAGYDAFSSLLSTVAEKLALMIVRDGEGATRVVEIEVSGAGSAREARKAARAIAESFLVKTAFFGGDPNWGRVVAALGRAGIRFNPDRVDLTMNGVRMVSGGLDTGREKKAARAIKRPEVSLVVELNGGAGSARMWTSDLTYDYVKINSEYRT